MIHGQDSRGLIVGTKDELGQLKLCDFINSSVDFFLNANFPHTNYV